MKFCRLIPGGKLRVKSNNAVSPLRQVREGQVQWQIFSGWGKMLALKQSVPGPKVSDSSPSLRFC